MTTFRAILPCPRCGSSGNASILSRLGSKGATYRIGDCPGPDIPPVDFEDTSLIVRRPDPRESTHVLMSWTCESCGLENFAEIVFADGCVRDIRGVDLDPATLSRIHYISEDLLSMLETIVGEPLTDDTGFRANWLDTLRAALLAGKRW
jgi:hypothetical protein